MKNIIKILLGFLGLFLSKKFQRFMNSCLQIFEIILFSQRFWPEVMTIFDSLLSKWLPSKVKLRRHSLYHNVLTGKQILTMLQWDGEGLRGSRTVFGGWSR